MNLLTQIWQKQPDTRFHQLINNLQFEYSAKNDEAGRVTGYQMEKLGHGINFFPIIYIDLYHLEDEKFIEFLREKVKEDWEIQ